MRSILKGLAMLVCCLPQMTYSQSDSVPNCIQDTFFLEEAIVKENRLQYALRKIPRNTRLVDRKEIEELPVKSLPGILSYQPGVDIRQRGPVGVQADISINGGTFEQTLVLLNGIKMADPQTGHHVMNLPVSYDNIEKIEILKGPASRQYGQNAYAGAVNFVTKIPESNRLHLRGYGGDFDSYGGNLSASIRKKKQAHYISLAADRSNGYRYNTDYQVLNGFYQGEFKMSSYSQLEVIAGLTDRKFGANGFYASEKAIDQYEEVQTGVANISFTHEKNNWKITPRISLRQNRDKYNYIRKDPEVYENLHITRTYSFETNISNVNKLGVTGVGFELLRAEINGDWLRGGTASKSNLDGFHRENAAVYLEHKFNLLEDKLNITPGAYVGTYTDFGTQFFPGLEAGYSLSDHLLIYGNAAKSFRIPTFYDQYYKSPNEVGNPDLKSEEAWSYQGGARFIRKGWKLEGSTFFRDNLNLIDWVLDENDVWHARNITVVETMGYELNASYQLHVFLIGDFSSLQRIDIGYKKITQNKLSDIDSRYALEHLNDQFLASVYLQLFKELRATVNFRNIQRVEQSGYHLLDAKIYWRANRYTLFAECTNLTNTHYIEVMTQMPGRWFRAGFTLDIPY